ncbi:TPA: RidA family protein [Pseudomonas putida]|jgi:enamine deaminase RidA (YjgF/YER057c/UK114 family)|uniref:RidA family protein n=1 Tax=Pseudomonas sp. 22515 TaxID=3453934 RepID=UPI000DB2CF96|nr:MAG: RidA family protein [Pseudomonas putida]HDS1803064.1 RidA family protein [Pseudomonas putida]HDS1809049.1 RidA family protein [Pseudomonas putida]
MITRRDKAPIMHRSVEFNGVVYLGGVIADAVDGVGMREQMLQVCSKLDKLLSAAGSDKTRLLSANLFITDMKNKSEMNEVWTSWLSPDCLPARATIGVSDLGAGVLVEVVVTAAKY